MEHIDHAMNISSINERERPYNDFLMHYAKYVQFLTVCEKDTRNKLKRIQKAREDMSLDYTSLVAKKNKYIWYYLNVKNCEPKWRKTLTFKHAKLKNLGIICGVNEDEKPKTLKNIIYVFKKISYESEPSVFQVDVQYVQRLKNMDIGSDKIRYKDLLNMKDIGKKVYLLENVCFSVNGLNKMLGEEFEDLF